MLRFSIREPVRASQCGGIISATCVRGRGRRLSRSCWRSGSGGRRRFWNRMSLTPILCFYRSQHDTQSWLSALVSILDTCSLLISVIEGPSSRQAQLTFVMARHAVVDLSGVFHVLERKAWKRREGVDRLPSKDFYRLCEALGDNHLQLCGDPAAAKRLDTIRAALRTPCSGSLRLSEDAVAGLGCASEGERPMERADEASYGCGAVSEGTGQLRGVTSR